MEPNVFIRYLTKGIANVLNSFGHEQYPSNNVDPCTHPWCLIIKYLNEGIGFLVGFGVVMQYPSKFQKICYRAQKIYGIPYKGYYMCMKYSLYKQYPLIV
jgi:hypothetical protein